ncbi:MAG: NusG domain II-containing protein [Clostridiales bacterium]|nr:NusG domain II-containing protein [Clostridiales bacterium]MCD8215756.1 NusG domain II-containing protein [Clostridiales bacterium]
MNMKYEGAVAKIYSDGKLVETVELEKVSEGYEFTVECEDGENTVRVEQGKICVISASCPDKVCVNQGWISDGVMPVVCLPNKLVIEIEGAEAEADAAAR